MRKSVLAACAFAVLLGAPTLAWAQTRAPAHVEYGYECVRIADPRISALLAQFPMGGPALRAAIAAAVEADPFLADVVVSLARTARPEQKQAMGAGLADAANYFAKISLDWAKRSEARIRTAMLCADIGTRIGFQLGEAPTLAQGIPGFNNAGATTNACVNGRPISPSGPGGAAGPIPGC
jgi:hypothetical protein